ncbi:hypothetical protein GCM10010383_38780 [Streptomyces lomondensis]|uniref:Uncharacterized protein n=1 Tax=Streptomyces lomondensis TaxID=68229 RepID=A0ABQ2X8V9_9ACTN|nr:hypothetical protein GCM10010383_38780 [Streptomyces lomondensis]
MNADAARRLARAYRAAGGRAVVTGPESFSMLFATALNWPAPSPSRSFRTSLSAADPLDV